MISLFDNKKLNAFGLDISDLSIKVMQLENKSKELYPKAFANIALPESVITNHLIAKPDKLSESIIRAITSARTINTKYVVVSVPEAKSFVRVIRMPKMAHSDVEGAIPFELEQDIPVPIDQVYTDWQIIREEGDHMDVLITATPKDYVDSLVEVLKMAGLKPVALELESQATARALVGKEDLNNPVLILDMSAAITSFIIVMKGGLLEYTSSIPIAGSTFTDSIAKALTVSQGEAEKLKKDSGLLQDSKKGNIRQAVLPILDNIVDEIRNVIRFHQEHSAVKQDIEKVLLCGGTARLAGLGDYISARLNLGSGKPVGRVTLGDPWVNVVSTEEGRAALPVTKDESLTYVTAIGLALRGANFSE